MTPPTHDLMAALGATPVAEILGSYERNLDERHDLQIEALRLRDEGESLGSARALTIRQALYDVERRLWLFGQLALITEQLIAATERDLAKAGEHTRGDHLG